MRRLLFIVAGAFVLYLVYSKWPDPTRAPEPTLHNESLAHQLFTRSNSAWRTRDIAYGHLHFYESSWAARTQREIALATDSARIGSLAFLEVQDTLPIEVFFVDSRQEMQRLVGQPIGGMVQSGERSAILVYNATYTPFLQHEITHLYSHNHWGSPRNGRWISEGLAALANGSCQGHSVADLVKGLHQDGRLIAWEALSRNFDSLDELSANLQAASMVDFIRARGGMPAVRDLWMSEDWAVAEKLFGQHVTAIDSSWQAHIAAHPNAARLNVPVLRDRGCAIL